MSTVVKPWNPNWNNEIKTLIALALFAVLSFLVGVLNG